MSIYDIVFLVAAVVIVLAYVKRGFVESILHFFKTIISIVLGCVLCRPISSILQAVKPDLLGPIALLISFALALLISYVGFSLLIKCLNGLIKSISMVDRVNKLLGGVFGLVMAFIFLMLIAAVFKLAFEGLPMYEESKVLRFLAESVAARLPLLKQLIG